MVDDNNKKVPLVDSIEFESLKKEILKLKERYNELLNEISLCLLDGDISENKDYQEAQEEKANLRNKILVRERELINLKNDNFKKQCVTYRITKTGEKKTVHLTSEWNTDASQGKISLNSPLGIALSKQPEGAVTVVSSNNNSYEIEVINKISLTT